MVSVIKITIILGLVLLISKYCSFHDCFIRGLTCPPVIAFKEAMGSYGLFKTIKHVFPSIKVN